MAFLETPSRILRRIEALQAQDVDLPSLPSLPSFEDSVLYSPSSSAHSRSSDAPRIEEARGEDEDHVPYHSTPTPASSHTTRSTLRLPPSTSSSATRFASSMRTSVTTARKSQVQQEESFEVSQILPTQQYSDSSSASVPKFHFPPEDASEDAIHMQLPAEEDRSFDNTVDPVGCPPLPLAIVLEEQRTSASKKYDYSTSVRSEPKASPINPRRDVSTHKSLKSRTRTPSLSRTTPSPTSMSSNSTPRSTYSHGARRMASPVPVIEPTEFQASQGHPIIAMEQELEVSLIENEQLSLSNERSDHDVALEARDQTKRGPPDGSPEPTFSSDEQPQSSGSSSARTPFPKAFLSPTASMTTIPIPVHVAHPTNTPLEGTHTPAQSSSEVAQDLATPFHRRRSFLLSLVHSTTRPRMAIPTPHPNFRMAPTPRPRMHPLSQTWTPSPAQSPHEPSSSPRTGPSLSPHNQLSFISTASSHDLTVHPRANASFDPVTGSKGVGRFDAVKLNTYLHGLNRRLQEENETLIGRLRVHGEEIEMGETAEELEREGFEGIEKAVLQEIEALQDALERCEQEKAAVTAESGTLCVQLEVLRSEKEEIDNDLRFEREERRKDKDRFDNRIAELGSGIEGVIKKLERKLEEAERGKADARDEAGKLEQKYVAVQEELAVANLRVEKVERALASSSDLGAEIKHVNERAAAYREETRAANERVHDLERKLRDTEKNVKASLEKQLVEMDAELRVSLEAQQSAEAQVLELAAEVNAAERRIDELGEQLTTGRQNAADILSQKDRLNKDLARAAEVARQMEDALEESEGRMISDEKELASRQARIVHLEKELETRRERSKSSALLDPDSSCPSNLDMEQLEAELDDAHREIAKLNYLLSESPSRKAIEMAKDLRIELLEKEKDELSERVRSLRTVMQSPGNHASPTMNTPISHRQNLAFKSPLTPGPPLKDSSWLQGNTNTFNASPLVAQIEHLRRELNLANNSIDAKVDKLEDAGMDIVGLTERLEDARSRTVTLEEQLGRVKRREERRGRRMQRARCLKCGGKVDLSKLIGAGEADQSSVELSSAMSPSPPTPPSETVGALRVTLKTVNSQLHTLRSQWESERKQLLGEKAVLQDAADQLNIELGTAKDEAKQVLQMGRQDADQEARSRTNVETELAKAKAVVNDLEETLKGERSYLLALSAEQKRMDREKESIFIQLQRAQSDMADVKVQLESVKLNNRELETELRATATVEQKTRLLETKVAENQLVIEQLREERESLAADHATLQRRYTDASVHVNRLRQELATSQKLHDECRHQIDLQVTEIEGLREEQIQQAVELERVELEKNKARADKSGIVKTVASLESDLRRVRADAEALGQDLKELKKERDRHRDELGKADRAQKQLSAQVRVANEQVEAQREKASKAVADLENHVCEPAQEYATRLFTQHKNECKGLMVQIRYLKAKFKRETRFRADLGYQKHFLLNILASYEKSEEQILASVARIGFVSEGQPVQKRRTLRAVAVAALFISKARRSSEIWREQSASKPAVAAALQEVRRRRAPGSLGYI